MRSNPLNEQGVGKCDLAQDSVPVSTNIEHELVPADQIDRRKLPLNVGKAGRFALTGFTVPCLHWPDRIGVAVKPKGAQRLLGYYLHTRKSWHSGMPKWNGVCKGSRLGLGNLSKG